MPTSEAFVDTSQAPRYLAQLCNHFARETRPVHTESDGDEHGFADFGWGTCNMRARPQGLLLQAEASDTEHLAWVQRVVGGHLERFGRRDGLTVRWSLGDLGNFGDHPPSEGGLG
jgi:hypothetical protein